VLSCFKFLGQHGRVLLVAESLLDGSTDIAARLRGSIASICQDMAREQQRYRIGFFRLR
jgi:hypothetical protein